MALAVSVLRGRMALRPGARRQGYPGSGMGGIPSPPLVSFPSS